MPYPYYQPFQAMFQQNQQVQQVQTNGIITVRNREEAISYPIAPGNSLTFKHETEPYIYTKTLGFSQFDRPIFEVFRLEREAMPQEPIAQQTPQASYLSSEDAVKMQNEIDALKDEIKFLREYIENETKEVVEDV